MSFLYDANGNQTKRITTSGTYTLTYNAENQMTDVTLTGGTTAAFLYDGDGNRVKGTVNGTTTVYIGNYYEWTGSTTTMKKYYYAGSIRIAMRTGATTLNWLLGDHLGSTSITTDGNGVRTGELRYKPWGENRYTYGTTPTTTRYTGQRQESYINLYWYGSRWFDDYLNRWCQPDSIIPSDSGTNTSLIVDYHETQFLLQLNQENRTRITNPNSQQPTVPLNSLAFDRYAYAENNPVNKTDPTGHRDCDIDCQERNEQVDPWQIHFGSAYRGGCWGAKDCLSKATLWKGDGTKEIGWGGSLSGIGPNFRGDISLALDGKGNAAVFIEGGGGASVGAGYSTGFFYSTTNAPSVDNLQGWATQAGMSIGPYIVGSIETIKFNGNGTEYRGTTIGGGITSPVPAEGHWTFTYAYKAKEINIFDVLINIFTSN